jgi:acetylornithine/succinyldiaminopimelate/putrescine aminotransferase
MWGIELTRDAAAVVPAALEQGVIVNRTAETVVRLLPPMIITPEEADEGLARLEKALVASQTVGPEGPQVQRR